MSDFDERLETIKARLAKALIANVNVQVDIGLRPGETNQRHFWDYKAWADNVKADQGWLLDQLRDAQRYREFVEAMEQAQMPGRCANCPIDSVCEENDTEACLDVRTDWQAWKERKK